MLKRTLILLIVPIFALAAAGCTLRTSNHHYDRGQRHHYPRTTVYVQGHGHHPQHRVKSHHGHRAVKHHRAVRPHRKAVRPHRAVRPHKGHKGHGRAVRPNRGHRD